MWGKKFMLVWGFASFWLAVGTHAFQTLPLIRNYHSTLSNFPAYQNTLSTVGGKVSTSSVFLALESQQDEQSASQATLRDKLRKVTGFSLTAFRAAWRTATGISLTAVYATALAASGLWIRKITSVILAVFPAWVSAPFLLSLYNEMCNLSQQHFEVPILSTAISDRLLPPNIRYSRADGTNT